MALMRPTLGRFCRVCLLLSGWLLANANANAAPATSRLVPVPFDSEYLVDSFGVDEGFPGNSCTGVAQTPDGYLWFSSFSGLARFNGLEFTLFTAENQAQIQDSRVVNCYADRRGRLLLGTVQGLAMKTKKGWQNFPESRSWGNRELIRSFAEGNNGELFVTTSLGRIFRVQGNRLEELAELPGKGGAYCGVDVNGQPLAVRGDFVGTWNGSAWQNLEGIENLVGRTVGAGQARDGGVWLVLTNELLHIRNRQTVRQIPLTNTVESFWQLLEDSHGNLWLPSIEKGLVRIAPSGAVKRFGKADGLPNNSGTRSVFEDAAGDLWVGSGVGGVTRFRPARFHAIGATVGLPDVAITSMTTLNDGRVVVGTYGGGLATLTGNHVTAVGETPSRFVQSIWQTQRGELYVGTLFDGLFVITNGQARSLNLEEPALPNSVTALFEDSQNQLWVGSINSVGYYATGKYHPLERPRQWQTEAVFFAERLNKAVIAANRNNLFQVIKTKGKLALKLWLTLPENARITSLLVDAQGRVWIGTAKSGMYVFAESRLCKVPKEVGLPDKNVVSLLESESRELWFGCGRNLVQVDSAALWRAASQTNLNLALHIFNQRDGLGAVDFPAGFQPTSYRDGNGRLWFALLHGAAAVDPAKLTLPTNAAPLVFEALSYLPVGSNQPVRVDLTGDQGPLVLPPGSRQIQINAALLNFDAPEKNSYRFRLDENNEAWHDSSGLNYVSFYDLWAGSHRLLVQASSGDGRWTPAKSIEFRVEEFFWRSPWLWALGCGGLVFLTGWLTRWRAEQRLQLVRANLLREQRLAELQKRLASVLENTSDFVGFISAEGRVLYLNAAGKNLIGLDQETAVTELVATELFSNWLQQLAVVSARTGTATAEVWAGEATLRPRAGQALPVSQVTIAHRHPDGTLDFCSTIIRDISATKRNDGIREALRSFSAALTQALEPMELGRTVAQECAKIFQHDAFFLVMVDAAGTVHRGGYWEDKPLGTTAPEPVKGEFTHVSENLKQLMSGREILLNRSAAEVAVHASKLENFGDTQRISASLMFLPISWEGLTVGILSVQSYTLQRYGPEDLKLLRLFADQCGPVVARLLTEEKLRQNEERLRLAMAAAKIGSWEITLPERKLIASAQAEMIYGYASGTMSGAVARLTERIPPLEVEPVQAQFDRLCAATTEDIACVHRLILADGTEKWLEVKGHLYRSGGGKEYRAIGITADISERRRAELEKEQLENHLRQTHKLDALGTLAGGIAHDFNNILTGIMGFNELANMNLAAGHPAAASLKEVARGAARAKALVAQIVAFSQRREQPRANLRLWPVAQEALTLLRSSLPANIQIRSQPSGAHKNIGVAGDATQIHQVIMNLGTNAGYAMRKNGGVLTVREELLELPAAGRFLRLTISDTGAGMPPAVMERIFEPFFSTKPAGEGTGLGLSVVHGILKSHGAEITVASQPGEGTRFEITFPAIALRPHQPTANEPATVVAGQGQHVLLVDDEERITHLASKLLQQQGYRVTSFNDPQSALAAFQQAPASFDLVLTDLTMPVMSGVALAREIHKLRPEVPIVLSTGFAGQSNPDEFAAVGIRHQLDKPYSMEELAHVLATALNENL